MSGRLTRDPEIRYTQGAEPIKVVSYHLAVNRYRKGGNDTDFIRCIAFGRNGEFAEQYLRKGLKILVEGHIQTGSYESDGRTVYTTDVIVERHEFCERREDRDAQDPVPRAYHADGLGSATGDDGDLPF